MWDNYLKVSEVPEEEWAGWKEDTYDLGDYGVSKMRMDRTGPSSVVLTEHTEDPATFEIKNIVFFPHGVEIRSELRKKGTFMAAQLYEWYDRIDENGEKKT